MPPTYIELDRWNAYSFIHKKKSKNSHAGVGLIAGGLFHRFKERFSYNEEDGHIIGEIPLHSGGVKCLLCTVGDVNSDDHFPLKSMGNDGVWHYRNLHNIIADVPELKIGYAQSGITFRTICAECNSNLGRNFDPHLLSLYNQFKIKKGLARIEYCYAKLIRCLAGHFVAASFSANPDNPRIQEFRDIFSHGTECGYRVYVAPFTGIHSLVLNEMAYVDLATKRTSFLFALKINPISIIFTKSIIKEPGYVELDNTNNKIRVDFDSHSDQFFPELYRGRNSPSIGALIGDSAAKSIIGVKKLWTYTGNKINLKFDERLLAVRQ